jgi:hypothetical protein
MSLRFTMAPIRQSRSEEFENPKSKKDPDDLGFLPDVSQIHLLFQCDFRILVVLLAANYELSDPSSIHHSIPPVAYPVVYSGLWTFEGLFHHTICQHLSSHPT